MDIMSNEILRQVEKEKDRALTVQIEKNRYLGIYKERVLLALTKNQVEEKLIYKQKSSNKNGFIKSSRT